MQSFDHRTLTDLSSDSKWLKYFPDKVFLAAIARAFPAIVIFAITKLSAPWLVLAFSNIFFSFVWAVFTVVEKSTTESGALKGGGRPFTRLLLLKIRFRLTKARYALGYTLNKDKNEEER